MIKRRARLTGFITIQLFWILPAGALIISFLAGKYGIAPEELIKALSSFIKTGINTNNAETVLFKIRLPRILAAFFIGGSLSVSGVVYQTVFRNPLVSPDLLGASSGAGLGACIAIMMNFKPWLVPFAAFFMGIMSVGITCVLCDRIYQRRGNAGAYVLTGIVVSAVCQSLISLIKYTADPYNQLQTIVFWLMGSMVHVEPTALIILLCSCIIGSVPLFLNGWKLNLLSFSDEEASAMGINTRLFRIAMLSFATFLCSAAVATSGIIGWVGLMVPHMVRSIIGADVRFLLPASFLLGSTLLLFIDDITRVLLVIELPLGLLTAIIGAPVFIVLLIKGKGTWI
ncbi:MAG: iron ABC transporter permease [Treponema sp.]|jgi:iron complex transport system permease protein|nr:iron ABC transporter permease [Treponema sp.]